MSTSCRDHSVEHLAPNFSFSDRKKNRERLPSSATGAFAARQPAHSRNTRPSSSTCRTSLAGSSRSSRSKPRCCSGSTRSTSLRNTLRRQLLQFERVRNRSWIISPTSRCGGGEHLLAIPFSNRRTPYPLPAPSTCATTTAAGERARGRATRRTEAGREGRHYLRPHRHARPEHGESGDRIAPLHRVPWVNRGRVPRPRGQRRKDRRPALDELLTDAKRRFDVLVVWRLGRLGRNLTHVAS